MGSGRRGEGSGAKELKLPLGPPTQNQNIKIILLGVGLKNSKKNIKNNTQIS